MGKLDGKVAFITGAARGQGRSHALTLAREGADIVAVDIVDQIATVPYAMATPEDLSETARMVEDLDRRIVAQRADTRNFAQLQETVQQGLSEFGHIDIVCANAGIASYAPSWELTEEQWDDMLAVNLKGVWLTTKAVIPHMIERGQGGAIVLTSSLAGLKGMAHVAHYVSAKHGVLGLMRTLANELAPYNIRVNSVHPTNVNTDMIQNEATYGLFSGGKSGTTREDVAPIFQMMNLLPIPWVEAQDISNAVLWLASDDARYVTGVALPIDAGAAIK